MCYQNTDPKLRGGDSFVAYGSKVLVVLVIIGSDRGVLRDYHEKEL